MSDGRDINNGNHQSHAATKTGGAPERRLSSEVTRDDSDEKATDDSRSAKRNLLGKIFWTPPWCRYDPNSPPTFSLFQNVLFGFAGAFTVANLYYSIAILNVLADDFNVSYIEVSRVPTLMQSGYAVGLLLICPLGDLFPRRPYTLILIFFTATMWYELPSTVAEIWAILTCLGLASASPKALASFWASVSSLLSRQSRLRLCYH